MLQPFEPLKEVHLRKLIALGKHYLVSQSYQRGLDPFEENKKIPLLLTDYDDIGLAKGHISALRGDKLGAIIDLRKEAHLQKIKSMLTDSSAYRPFWAVVRSRKELEDRVNLKFKDHMQRYIATQTNWKISRNSTVNPQLQLIFGEIYIVLKHKSETRRLSFADLEKC